MSKSEDKSDKSFWQTVPGIIAAFAALITAIGGCIAVVFGIPAISNAIFGVTPTPIISQTTFSPTLNIPTLTQAPTQQSTLTSIPDTVIPPTPVPPTAIPPTEVLVTSLSIEGENGDMSNGAYPEKNKDASNNTYVNMGGPTGTLTFTVHNMAAGQYELVIRYCKYVNNTPEYSDPGYQNVYVNNNSPVRITYFKTFGDSDGGIIWQDGAPATISLNRGTNVLVIRGDIPGFPGVSIDRISIRLIN